MKQNEKLYLIALNAFEILDYDRNELTVTISVDGHEGVDTFALSPDDIMDRAMAAQMITSYFDPIDDESDWMVEINEKKYPFTAWWMDIDPQDREMLYSSAVATLTAQGLERLYRQLTKPEAVAA